jgi:acetyl-CoA synthetase
MDSASYGKLYRESIKDPGGFFARMAREMLVWDEMFTEAHEEDGDYSRWFINGRINACYNAVDVHAARTPEKKAFIYTGNDGSTEEMTYAALLERICCFANLFSRMGLSKGDCVSIYASNSPDVFCIILACSRLGLVANCVFGGFSSLVLASRIKVSDSKLLVTVDFLERGETTQAFYSQALEALRINADFGTELLVLNDRMAPEQTEFKTHWLSELALDSSFIRAVPVDSNHPIMYIFTSGSSGVAKGIVHCTAGYLLGTALTIRHCFNYTSEDLFFCTADIGWLAAGSHALYGPLLIGGTSVIFAGKPFWPSPLRLFDIISELRCTHFYTAPTVIRMLQKQIEEDHGLRSIYCQKRYDLSSLKAFGSVGEPLGLRSCEFIREFFGKEIPVVNTYWQTETGSIMLAPVVGSGDPSISCSVGVPFFGIRPRVVVGNKEAYRTAKANEKGALLFEGSWPARALTILKDHTRFISSYFSAFPGFFYTGDEAVVDKDGNHFILGRIDDIVNINGHRLSTAEVENVVSQCEGVSEAAVVPEEDPQTGQSICICVVAVEGACFDRLSSLIMQELRKKIGAVMRTGRIVRVRDLPKTRTGKIMRRLLRDILSKAQTGDTSSCSNPDVVPDIYRELHNRTCKT